MGLPPALTALALLCALIGKASGDEAMLKSQFSCRDASVIAYSDIGPRHSFTGCQKVKYLGRLPMCSFGRNNVIYDNTYAGKERFSPPFNIIVPGSGDVDITPGYRENVRLMDFVAWEKSATAFNLFCPHLFGIHEIPWVSIFQSGNIEDIGKGGCVSSYVNGWAASCIHYEKRNYETHVPSCIVSGEIFGNSGDAFNSQPCAIGSHRSVGGLLSGSNRFNHLFRLVISPGGKPFSLGPQADSGYDEKEREKPQQIVGRVHVADSALPPSIFWFPNRVVSALCALFYCDLAVSYWRRRLRIDGLVIGLCGAGFFLLACYAETAGNYVVTMLR